MRCSRSHVENSQTACLLVGTEPMARSSAGLTLRLANRGLGNGGLGNGESGNGESANMRSRNPDSGLGIRFGAALFEGLTVEARVARARAREREQSETAVRLTTVAADCA
jgi:hypothetical protein